MSTPNFGPQPWRVGRPSGRSRISASEDSGEWIRLPSYQGDLSDVAQLDDVLAARVNPIWEALRGREASEIARRIMELLHDLHHKPTLEAAVQLYQLWLADWVMPWAVWPHLREALSESDLADSLRLHELFVHWASESPDEDAIGASLFMLTHIRRSPPPAPILELGGYRRFVPGVARLVAVHYDADEDLLIGLARRRRLDAISVLCHLRSVEKPENREWLLTAGYDSGLYEGGIDYEPAAYFAAVHGRLLERLREAEIAPDHLVHYARIVAIMAQAAGGASSWKTLPDYADGPAVVERLFEHIGRTRQSLTLLRELRDLLCFLYPGRYDAEHMGEYWPPESCQRLYALGRLLFEPPFADDTALSSLWWEQPKPTLDDVRAGNLAVLDEVLENASDYADESAIADVVAWAIEYLALEADWEAREQRALELTHERMPGPCKGGLAGVTHEGLGSVYGQVLLQVALALRGFSPMGWPLLRASLETDFPHLPAAAASVLEGWPDSAFPPQANAFLRAALERADDAEVRSQLEKAIRMAGH